MKKEIKRKADPARWNEYRIYSMTLDLFNAYLALKGTGNMNLDITTFCDVLKNKLIDIYGRE